MPPTAGDRRPVLVYDGRCGFCAREARRLERLTGGRVRLESFRDPGIVARHPGLTAEACAEAIQLVHPDGSIESGAAAVMHALALNPALAPLTWVYALPLVRPLLDAGYRAVARNRFGLPGTPCAGDACRSHAGEG